MNVFVVGFPYVRERFFAVWRAYPEPGDLRFLMPRVWTAKGGAVVFHPPKDPRVCTARAYFHDSHAPVIGGLLKGWMPAFPWHLWRMRRHVDLVYSCSEPTLLTTLYYGVFTKLLGKKHVCFTWENIPYEQKLHGPSRFVHLLLLRLNLMLSDGLICGNSEAFSIHSSFIIRHSSFRKLLLATIPMSGVNADFFQSMRCDKVLGSHDWTGRVVYAFIGAIGKRKGIHLAVRALPEVLKQVPDAHLVIAGSGEYERQIEEEIERAGVRAHVTRIPWLDDRDVRTLLAVSDVFLYPSIPTGGWAEQFGYSMTEASLMELPVISTRSGSIPAVVRNGETGILVPPDDTAALAGAMVRLGTDGDLRRRMGAAGRRFIAERYSHAVVARQFSDFFSVINRIV